MSWTRDDDPNLPYLKADDSGMKMGVTSHKVVRELEVGDRIILRARNKRKDESNSPCMNYVVAASVCVYWAV